MGNNVLQLDSHELSLVKKRRSHLNQLTFAILLKHFQLELRYPNQASDVDPMLRQTLTLQLDMPEGLFNECKWNNRTAERFRAEIREYLSYRKANDSDRQHLIAWLMAEHERPCDTWPRKNSIYTVIAQ